MPTYAGDEFAMLSENAADAGLEGPLPEVRRLAMNGLSALRWGAGDPEVVFIHGGAQNAHTWDTVIIALERPALAIDLPGHGHSAWRQDHDYSPRQLAAAVAPLVRTIAPDAKLVVGMSLGGLTALSLAATNGAARAVGDAGRLLQVSSNLIENALRLTPAGGIITVAVAEGRISVRDTGPGLAQEDLPRAFERFYLHGRYRSGSGVGSAAR